MTKIFVSYSRMQGKWVAASLVPVLNAGGAEVLIDWDRFKAGTSVVGQMDRVQDQADVQLLCLSAEYLASDYCEHEMRRAISDDPQFAKGLNGRSKRGVVVPIRLDGAAWPAEIDHPDPLYVDMHDPAVACDAWRLLLDPCQVKLGTPAQTWLAARDGVERYLRRGQSVNLLVQREGIAWGGLVDHIVKDRVSRIACVDLLEPATTTRHGLLNRILQRLGARETVRRAPNDLADFGRILATMPKPPTRVAIRNFDLAPHRKSYGLDLYASLRWLIQKRQLVLLVHSRSPFNALLPRNDPLSRIDLKTVELS